MTFASFQDFGKWDNRRNLFPSKGCCLQSHYLATGLRATLYSICFPI
jgi:hypothetical protein